MLVNDCLPMAACPRQDCLSMTLLVQVRAACASQGCLCKSRMLVQVKDACASQGCLCKSAAVAVSSTATHRQQLTSSSSSVIHSSSPAAAAASSSLPASTAVQQQLSQVQSSFVLYPTVSADLADLAYSTTNRSSSPPPSPSAVKYSFPVRRNRNSTAFRLSNCVPRPSRVARSYHHS